MHTLITGASQGIGAALARRLAAAGHEITLVARDADALKRLADDLPTRTFVRPTDLSDPDVADALVADAEAALGPVDVLVNNAGIQYVEPAAGVDPTRLARILATNLTTPLRLVHRVLPGQSARGRGAIVNITSLAGTTPTPGMAHYSGTKAGLSAASEALRVEVARSGVHVLTVYPGPVETRMSRAAKDAIGQHWTARLIPTGTPEALADRIERALRRRSARVIYPRIYAPTWWLAGIASTVVLAFAPPSEPI